MLDAGFGSSYVQDDADETEWPLPPRQEKSAEGVDEGLYLMIRKSPRKDDSKRLSGSREMALPDCSGD